jgi:hypothetical protein
VSGMNHHPDEIPENMAHLYDDHRGSAPVGLALRELALGARRLSPKRVVGHRSRISAATEELC